MNFPTYPKMPSVFLRNPMDKWKTVLPWQWAMPEFEYLAGLPWVFHEKIHGTNIRVCWDGAVVTFGGRTDNAQMPSTIVNRLKGLFANTDIWDAEFGSMPAVLYGEGFGAGIQSVGRGYIPNGVDFALFDVLRQGQDGEWRWQPREEVERLANGFDLRLPPVLMHGATLEAACAAMLARDTDPEWPLKSSIGTGAAPLEGWVGRPLYELRNRYGERVICKLKCEDIPAITTTFITVEG